MNDYPRYILNFVFADDQRNNISDKVSAPTHHPDTAKKIETEAKAAVQSGAGTVIVINGSHTELMSAGGAEIDAFLSHHDEVNDDFPTINIVLRAR